MTEIFKSIEENSCYEVSNMGNVRNIENGEIMTKYIYNKYKTVFLGKIRKNIHILVAKAFIPNPDNKLQVRHINSVKFDNLETNLEWVTLSEIKNKKLLEKNPIIILQANEIFKPVPGFEDRYEVSNMGRFVSIKTNRILTQHDNCGYKRVDIGKFHKSTHVLVALAFIPNPDNKPIVDHINRNRSDNRVENLRWVTSSENARNISHIKNTFPKKISVSIKILDFVKRYEINMIDYKLQKQVDINIDNFIMGFANEIYKKIQGLDMYEVSNHGRARNSETGYIFFQTEREKYKSVRIKNCEKRVHRLVAKTFIPNPDNKKLVDHINTDRSDNRVENLRWVTCSENNRNQPIRKDNKSGTVGVYLRQSSSRWVATYRENRILITIGSYDTKEEAIKSRRKKINEIYGEFVHNREKEIYTEDLSYNTEIIVLIENGDKQYEHFEKKYKVNISDSKLKELKSDFGNILNTSD